MDAGIPVGKNDLALEIFFFRLLALWVVHGEGTNVRCYFGQTARFHPAHGKGGANNRVLVASGNIGACEVDLAEKEHWIGGIWPY